jgi:hypothetical protein
MLVTELYIYIYMYYCIGMYDLCWQRNVYSTETETK